MVLATPSFKIPVRKKRNRHRLLKQDTVYFYFILKLDRNTENMFSIFFQEIPRRKKKKKINLFTLIIKM